ALGRPLLRLALVDQRNGGQVHLALAEGAERLALECQAQRRPEVVNSVREEQHLDTAGAGGLELRATCQPADIVASEEIDLVLVRPEVGDVVGERAPAVSGGAAEPGQLQKLLLPADVLVDALFQDRSESLEE